MDRSESVEETVRRLLQDIEDPTPWGVYEFPWGTAVRYEPTGEWHQICLRPDGRTLDLAGIKVILHENGIEFVLPEG